MKKIILFGIFCGLFVNKLIFGQVSIGTNTPASSAILELQSVNKGFIPPRLTKAQRDAFQNPVDGMIIFNLDTGGLDYFFQGTWNSLEETASASACGLNLTVNHVAGTVAPVTKTIQYGTAMNIPGETAKCWITQNLGADRQATSDDDATEASAGWYWQFNRKQGFRHDGTSRFPNTGWVSSFNENSGWLPVNDPCALQLGTGWRLPSMTEWSNVISSGFWTTWFGPWNSALKIHKAGHLSILNGSLEYRGTTGNYWSGTMKDNSESWDFYFSGDFCHTWSDSKAWGYPVRCLKETGYTFSCGQNMTVSHPEGYIAPVNKIVEYGTVTNVPGEPTKCWITQNLGSDHQAVNLTDATEESAGWYWQFNFSLGFMHNGVYRTPYYPWISNMSSYSNWQPQNDPCTLLLDSAWRLPTGDEWFNVMSAAGWTNASGPWNSLLKLHNAGCIFYLTGNLEFRGTEGYYWSSERYNDNYGFSLWFSYMGSNVSTQNMSNAYPVRCLKE